MHSYNRTLLSKLGFADDDKKDNRHDLACQYLAIPETHERLVRRLFPDGSMPFENTTPDGEKRRGNTHKRFTGLCKPSFEVALNKGDGQYKTTIGFIDLVLPFTTETWTSDIQGKASNESEWKEIKHDPRDITRWKEQVWILAEVKIGRVGVGDILRQVNLYREYIGGLYQRYLTAWVIATLFDLTEADAAQLYGEKIYHFKLGEKFESFLAHQKNELSVPSKSPEI